MATHYDTVIFDLDGTLLDSLDDLADSINMALSKCGFPKRTRKEVCEYIGGGAEVLVRKALPNAADHVDFDAVYKSFKELYAVNMFNKTQPYLGIPELIAELCGRSIKMAVVSNKPQDAVTLLMEDYFDNLISVAIGADTNTPAKPDPQGLLKAMELLGSKPEHTIFMGDSDVDILTAKNAGVFSVACAWGMRDKSILAAANPGAIIDAPLEVLPILDGSV